MDQQLAQVNIARMLGPIDGPVMADFVANLDPINILAEASPGFIWRLTGDGNDATSLRIFDDDYMIVNMSVWQDIDALASFTYRTMHTEIMRRRKEWFEKMPEMYFALWWIPGGHIPTVDEAMEKLLHLRANGPGREAFTFKERF